MSTSLLHHPVVRACIAAILRSFGIVNKHDLEDAVADVQLRALESFQRRPPPTELGAMRALCAKIAQNYGIDRGRKLKFREQYDTGLCAEPDEHGPLCNGEPRDPVDERRQLEALGALFQEGAMPEHGAEILHGVASGESLAEIGQDLGITADTVRSRLRKMRSLFSARLAGIGLVARGRPSSPELAALDEAA
jgi:DNA-directed RNA polymerase specialized sigma24 family protein